MALRLAQLDKKVFAKAVGIMMLGWLALPIIYYLLKKKENSEEKEEKVKENERKE